MTPSLIAGILGSLILVAGAARPAPNKKTKPIQVTKNRLFLIGSIILLFFSRLGYKQGGTIFFFILEILIVIACILMMLDTDDRIDATILAITGTGLSIRSIYIFHGYQTIIFIIGLVTLGLGYAFSLGSMRRDIALTIGSLIVAIFSLLEANRIFFGLNLFFFICSGYYVRKNIKKKGSGKH